MTVYLFTDHLLNLVLPAALIAFLLVAATRVFPQFFGSKKALVADWRSQAAINFVVGSGVLVAGLALLGRDGKALTYAALVLAMALSQWCLLGGWRR